MGLEKYSAGTARLMGWGTGERKGKCHAGVEDTTQNLSYEESEVKPRPMYI